MTTNVVCCGIQAGSQGCTRISRMSPCSPKLMAIAQPDQRRRRGRKSSGGKRNPGTSELFECTANAADRLGQAGRTHREGNAEIPLTRRTKRAARQRDDSKFFERAAGERSGRKVRGEP